MNLNDLNNNFITTKEAAKLLYLSKYTIRKYIKVGKINAFKLGKQYLIPKDEITKLLKKNDVKFREIASTQGKKIRFTSVKANNFDMQNENINESFQTFINVLIRSLKS